MRLVHEAGVSLVRGIRGAKGVFVWTSLIKLLYVLSDYRCKPAHPGLRADLDGFPLYNLMRLVHEAGVSLVRGIRGAKGVFVCLSSRFYI
jgi:hypothetical protein